MKPSLACVSSSLRFSVSDPRTAEAVLWVTGYGIVVAKIGIRNAWETENCWEKGSFE